MSSSDDPEEGVSEALARERAARVSDLRYNVTFAVPYDRSAPITGRVLIEFGLDDVSHPLALDSRISTTGIAKADFLIGKDRGGTKRIITH